MVKTGWIYTRDGSFVWDKLRQRTVPSLIIHLFINMGNQTEHPSRLASWMIRQKGGSVCLLLFIHTRLREELPFFAQDGWSICSMNQTRYVQVSSPKEFKLEPRQVTTPHLKIRNTKTRIAY